MNEIVALMLKAFDHKVDAAAERIKAHMTAQADRIIAALKEAVKEVMKELVQEPLQARDKVIALVRSLYDKKVALRRGGRWLRCFCWQPSDMPHVR